MLISKKKGSSSEFCKFSPRFMQHTRARHREPQLSKVFGGKQKCRFLMGEKTPGFAKFQCEIAGKTFAFFCAYREHCLGLFASRGKIATAFILIKSNSILKLCCYRFFLSTVALIA